MPVHVGEAALDAVVVKGEEFVVEAEEVQDGSVEIVRGDGVCLLYTSPSPRDLSTSRMPSSA